MTAVTIYHNPACGTSRNTLAILRHCGIEPEVIHYLETPPSREVLTQLIKEMGISVRDLLRKNTEPYEKLALDKASWTDEQLINFMVEHPILINRPIVVSPLGTKLCRPSEQVLALIDNPQVEDFVKEDGKKLNLS